MKRKFSFANAHWDRVSFVALLPKNSLSHSCISWLQRGRDLRPARCRPSCVQARARFDLTCVSLERIGQKYRYHMINFFNALNLGDICFGMFIMFQWRVSTLAKWHGIADLEWYGSVSTFRTPSLVNEVRSGIELKRWRKMESKHNSDLSWHHVETVFECKAPSFSICGRISLISHYYSKPSHNSRSPNSSTLQLGLWRNRLHGRPRMVMGDGLTSCLDSFRFFSHSIKKENWSTTVAFLVFKWLPALVLFLL